MNLSTYSYETKTKKNTKKKNTTTTTTTRGYHDRQTKDVEGTYSFLPEV